jgi:hypothetical protein
MAFQNFVQIAKLYGELIQHCMVAQFLRREENRSYGSDATYMVTTIDNSMMVFNTIEQKLVPLYDDTTSGWLEMTVCMVNLYDDY